MQNPMELPPVIDCMLVYLNQQELFQVCTVSKTWFMLSVTRIWCNPIFRKISQVEKFLESANNTVPFFSAPESEQGYDNESGYRKSTYGDLVKSMDLSMLNGRWDKLDASHGRGLLNACRRIKLLDFNLCTKLTDDGLKDVFCFLLDEGSSNDSQQQVPPLEYLDLSLTGLEGETLAMIIEKMPGIKTLNINETSVDDAALMVLPNRLPKLEFLRVDQCMDITDESIEYLAKNCQNLRFIGAEMCPFVTNYELIEQINSKSEWTDEYSSYSVVSFSGFSTGSSDNDADYSAEYMSTDDPSTGED